MDVLFAILALCFAGYLVYLLLVDCRSCKTTIKQEQKIPTLEDSVQKQKQLRSLAHTELTSNFKPTTYYDDISI